MKKQINKKGFTLIEVVLVLAIGGLIFLLAFLAFQQATTNRPDTQRRSDAGQVVSEIENALGDGNGTTFSDTATLGDFVDNYLNGSAGGDGGTFERNNIQYTIEYRADIPDGEEVDSGSGYMAVFRDRVCQGNGMTQGNGNGDYAVLALLEKGVACRDNQ